MIAVRASTVIFSVPNAAWCNATQSSTSASPQTQRTWYPAARGYSVIIISMPRFCWEDMLGQDANHGYIAVSPAGLAIRLDQIGQPVERAIPYIERRCNDGVGIGKRAADAIGHDFAH